MMSFSTVCSLGELLVNLWLSGPGKTVSSEPCHTAWRVIKCEKMSLFVMNVSEVQMLWVCCCFFSMFNVKFKKRLGRKVI